MASTGLVESPPSEALARSIDTEPPGTPVEAASEKVVPGSAVPLRRARKVAVTVLPAEAVTAVAVTPKSTIGAPRKPRVDGASGESMQTIVEPAPPVSLKPS